MSIYKNMLANEARRAKPNIIKMILEAVVVIIATALAFIYFSII